MSSRLQALGEALERPLLVTNLTNVYYLTGFDSSNAALLVEPGGGARLYTDFRYVESARAVEGVEVHQLKRALMRELAGELSGTVQFEADVLPYLEWERLAGEGVKLEPTSGIVDRLRAVKDEQEQDAVRHAALVGDRAFEALTAETFVGRTERELAWRLRDLAHAHGADDMSFDPVVASGPRGGMPHASPTESLVERGTLVVVDWGVKVDGYCSDCTRTLSTGRLPDRLREIYELCLAAQVRACENVEAGMTGVAADALARDPIAAAGYGEHFGHGLGHGVGLLVHEPPRLSTESEDVLEPGQVVTVEPGIYLEGLGGVRIEDLAIVRDGGLELLTSFPKALIEVS